MLRFLAAPFVSTALAAWILFLAATTRARSDRDACTSFRLANFTDVVLNSATFYAQGDLVNISNLVQTLETSNLPAFCRLQLAITTNSTANSTANTEIWLPEEWNGRLLAIGNGGFSGAAFIADLGLIAVNQGFAGMSTDTGHSSEPFDASWAGPGNDNAIVDFAWRAVHLSVVTAKEVIQQYYGTTTQSKSYYLGCSTGGRQGLKEVQDFPDDFDGVVIGSPANWLAHQAPWALRLQLDVQPINSSRWISDAVWNDVIHPEVLKQCDQLDGLEDGVITNPLVCNFRPESLACRPNQDPSSCLNLDQIESLHKIYADYYDTNQTYIFAGLYPGGEPGFSQYILGLNPVPIAEEYYRYFIFNDTTWSIDRFNFEVIEAGEKINTGNADAINPNITAFANRKGKLIHYFGWGENLISAGNSVHYYETVHAFTRSQSALEIDDFYRLFPVPGMQHCLSGLGPNAFGGSGQAAAGMPPLSYDAEHNIVASMVRWVEEGVAPETIIGTYYNNDTIDNGVGFTRPLCKYPLTAVYVGENPKDAGSFKCA